jgi:hypothetical protein
MEICADNGYDSPEALSIRSVLHHTRQTPNAGTSAVYREPSLKKDVPHDQLQTTPLKMAFAVRPETNIPSDILLTGTLKNQTELLLQNQGGFQKGVSSISQVYLYSQGKSI